MLKVAATQGGAEPSKSCIVSASKAFFYSRAVAKCVQLSKKLPNYDRNCFGRHIRKPTFGQRVNTGSLRVIMGSLRLNTGSGKVGSGAKPGFAYG